MCMYIKYPKSKWGILIICFLNFWFLIYWSLIDSVWNRNPEKRHWHFHMQCGGKNLPIYQKATQLDITAITIYRKSHFVDHFFYFKARRKWFVVVLLLSSTWEKAMLQMVFMLMGGIYMGYFSLLAIWVP